MRARDTDGDRTPYVAAADAAAHFNDTHRRRRDTIIRALACVWTQIHRCVCVCVCRLTRPEFYSPPPICRRPYARRAQTMEMDADARRARKIAATIACHTCDAPTRQIYLERAA